MTRPDVALISPHPSRRSTHGGGSGVASYTASLAKALAERGASVTVIADRDSAVADVEQDGLIEVRRCFSRGFNALPSAAEAAIQTGAPIVHVQHEHFLYGPSSWPGIFPALRRIKASKRAGVVTMHQVVHPAAVNREFVRMHRIPAPAGAARAGLRLVQERISRSATMTIVHEAAFARTVSEARVIPHGHEIPSAPKKATALHRLGLGDGFIALCFGFLAPYKGLELAAAAAEASGADVQLVVAGGDHPRLKETYSRRLRDRWGHCVRFTGYVPDAQVGDWFAAADVAMFLYPQPHASSGALALALAYGTPFLVSPQLAETIGAPRDVIAPMVPDDLSGRLSALARQPDRVDDLRRAAAVLRSGRSWHEVAGRHLDVYEEVTHVQGLAGV